MHVYVNEDYKYCSMTPEGCAHIVATEKTCFTDYLTTIIDVKARANDRDKVVTVYVDRKYKNGESYTEIITWIGKEVIDSS